jgi:uncharacterized protein YndB with AHSA1/START domain
MPEILHEIDIDAPAEAVFRAITTEAGFMEWWTLDVETTPAEGGIATFGFYERSTVFRMRITSLLFELKEDEGGGTVLQFSHTGWRSVTGYFRQCNTTWGALMYRLRDYCEGKTPGAFFPG